MASIVQAAGVVIFTRTQPASFLLLKHIDRWDLPKGHSEPGESLRDTALRETEEETGIAASTIELDETFQFVLEYDVSGKKRGNYRKQVTYFLGYIPAPTDIELTEHIGFEWLAWPAPPIQQQTIDPLLTSVARYFSSSVK